MSNLNLVNGASAPASGSNSTLAWVIGVIVTSFGCYKLGKKKGRKETERKYEDRLEALLDRVNTILAEKEAQN